MTKLMILDTNVLLHDSKAIFNFGPDQEIIIPLAVLEELDHKKYGVEEINRNARQVIRTLEEMRNLGGNFQTGVKMENGGLIRVVMGIDVPPQELEQGKSDNRILGSALRLMRTEPDKQVIVVSRDINLRLKCDSVGILVENYENFKENDDGIYTGTKIIEVPGFDVDLLYTSGSISSDGLGELFENQYVILTDYTNKKHTALARKVDDKLIKVKTHKDIWGISPRNVEQVFAMNALLDPSISLVNLVGAAGTGKTLLSLACGVSSVLDQKNYKKLIITKPTQDVGSKSIGYLPGELECKMRPYLQSFYDNFSVLCDGKEDEFLEDQQDFIEIESISYLRGRTISGYFVVDEAQNLTKEEIKTIISRAAEGAKFVILGDVGQIDAKNLNIENNGFSHLINKFKNYKFSATIKLIKGERSELATIASLIL